MMNQLQIKNGEILQIKSATVPLGRFVKIQPQSENFLEITNPRAVYVHLPSSFIFFFLSQSFISLSLSSNPPLQA